MTDDVHDIGEVQALLALMYSDVCAPNCTRPVRLSINLLMFEYQEDKQRVCMWNVG